MRTSYGSTARAHLSRRVSAMALTHSAESPLSVVAVNKAVADWIGKLGTVWVEGQLSQVTVRPGSSIVFMRLRDVTSDASISLVAATATARSVVPPLTEGARVVVLASVEFWSKRGDVHLRARQIRAVGLGELLARLEQLRALLAAEGVFEPARKQPLPFLPRRIGLICGRNSDAQRDVMVNARKRWPGVDFEVREVAVQGTHAVAEVRAAVTELDAIPDVDVIVITRGGGSVEDLLPFSDEGLVRTVVAATTPVVSAIGHERDRPILDDAADVRASTPTDAARRIVPDWAEESARVAAARTALATAITTRLRQEQHALDALRASGALHETITNLQFAVERLVRTRLDARRALSDRLTAASTEVTALTHRLRALSPAATLERGYAIVHNAEGVIATSPQDVPTGTQFTARLCHGSITGQRLPDVPSDAATTPGPATESAPTPAPDAVPPSAPAPAPEETP